jgi:hypothetical protein
MMPARTVWLVSEWCATCCTRHTLTTRCPGDLIATGVEKPGRSVHASTPRGIECYTVMLAPSYDLWRARILTQPNVLWLVPGGRATVKFAAASRVAAEREAWEFIHAHCQAKGYTVRAAKATPIAAPRLQPNGPAPRKARFLPIRFGVGGPSEVAGTGNLSETGLFILTETPVRPGTRLRIVLEIDHRPVPMLGHVCWSRSQHYAGRAPGMGIRLIQPPRPYVNYVQALA